MLNIDDFTKRLQKVMDYYEESASSFAEKIGVQRSSISHILSGRNKPSLDFVLKILSTYPDVNLYWLFNGKGEFPSKQKSLEKDKIKEETKQELQLPFPVMNEKINTKIKNNKTIEQIVIFYSDGSFKNYQN
ncbi:transcriptional regulator [Flavivirga aquatica]|uniref:Transcriptional regulator n=1 Tax=Flavivirga aquatica TaxID=1849968 RepID=A0A1E5TB15_9FLAO|nr:helix-turn-helix transcriptional regulator [Flavivirga aquatica]OEK08551.1 transcriptional regulator [Flavivirga aquatica]